MANAKHQIPPAYTFSFYARTALLGLVFAFCFEHLKQPALNAVQLMKMRAVAIGKDWLLELQKEQQLEAAMKPFNATEFIENYQCNPQHQMIPKIVSHDPLVMVLDNFLADGEGDYLIEEGSPYLQASTVTNFGETNEVSDYRTSSTAFFGRSGNPVLKCIEERVEKVTNFPLVNTEPIQLLRYHEGQQYKVHHDSFGVFDEFYQTQEYNTTGDRIATVFVYLTSLEPGQGGETEFPQLGLKVSPKKNSAAFWMNLKDLSENRTVDQRTEHSGLPIIGQHTKFGLNIWIREKCYEGCGNEQEYYYQSEEQEANYEQFNYEQEQVLQQ